MYVEPDSVFASIIVLAFIPRILIPALDTNHYQIFSVYPLEFQIRQDVIAAVTTLFELLAPDLCGRPANGRANRALAIIRFFEKHSCDLLAFIRRTFTYRAGVTGFEVPIVFLAMRI
jgi:hypothetical protein